jgi:hypothetical protein
MNETYRRYLLEGQRAGIRYGIGMPHNIQRGLVGSRVGNRSGSSLEFMDHREYMPGDDIRRIDWNAFARSDRLSIKLFRDEVNPYVDIIIDCSRSMALPGSEKARATLGLAGLFAQAAQNSDYTFAAWRVGFTCEKVTNGTDQPILWEDIDFDCDISGEESFRRQLSPWRPRGIRVFLSDLFWQGVPAATLSILAEKASAVFVIQVLAESDVNPAGLRRARLGSAKPRQAPPRRAGRGNVRLYDWETAQTKDIFIDAVAEERYRQNLAHHQYNWSRGCRQLGVAMTTVVAEKIVQKWDLGELVIAEMLKVL